MTPLGWFLLLWFLVSVPVAAFLGAHLARRNRQVPRDVRDHGVRNAAPRHWKDAA